VLAACCCNQASCVLLPTQGLASLIPTTPDFWQDNQFGFVLDSGAGPALTRASPTLLLSAVPAAAFSLRLTALAVQVRESPEPCSHHHHNNCDTASDYPSPLQTDSISDWLTDLAAEVTAAAPNPRPAHEAWWTSFWSRSHVAVNSSNWQQSPLPKATPGASPPVAGSSLWLRASSLSAQVC
jgi:hypothetical protein